MADAEAVLSMQMYRFRNPHTGAPTVGPLAILVDAAAGIVNHYRRRNGQWTVSSELSMDLSPDLGDLDGPVYATAHTLAPLGATSLGVCTLTYRGSVIGCGTVRSFFKMQPTLSPNSGPRRCNGRRRPRFRTSWPWPCDPVSPMTWCSPNSSTRI